MLAATGDHLLPWRGDAPAYAGVTQTPWPAQQGDRRGHGRVVPLLHRSMGTLGRAPWALLPIPPNDVSHRLQAGSTSKPLCRIAVAMMRHDTVICRTTLCEDAVMPSGTTT